MKIWNSVVFFNYLQVAMGGPREAGTRNQYQQADKAFFEVLDKFQPEYVIVWGNAYGTSSPVSDGRMLMTSTWMELK